MAEENVAAPAPWYQGADTETVGYMQVKGWDKLDAPKAALEAVKARREAEKFIGAPPDQLLRMPKDASDAEGWNKVHSRLGVPETADKYDFSNVKYADGSDLDKEFTDLTRSLAHELKLDQSRASILADKLAKFGDLEESEEAAQIGQRTNAAREQLRKDWGAQFGTNTIIAENGLKSFLMSQANMTSDQASKAVETMLQIADKSVGLDVFMKFAHSYGLATGQDAFIRGERGGQLTTPASVDAKIAGLTNDKAWREKYWNGDTKAVQEFNDLTALKAQMIRAGQNRNAF